MSNEEKTGPDAGIPEGVVVTERITVTQYLRPDGQSGYALHTTGDGPMTTYLGLLMAAQYQVLKWGDVE